MEYTKHKNARCNSCEIVITQGILHKCLMCKNFDLCDNCYKKKLTREVNHDQKHEFQTILTLYELFLLFTKGQPVRVGFSTVSFICPVCGNRENSPQDLYLHGITYHNVPLSENVICPICATISGEEGYEFCFDNFGQHLTTIHSDLHPKTTSSSEISSSSDSNYSDSDSIERAFQQLTTSSDDDSDVDVETNAGSDNLTVKHNTRGWFFPENLPTESCLDVSNDELSDETKEYFQNRADYSPGTKRRNFLQFAKRMVTAGRVLYKKILKHFPDRQLKRESSSDEADDVFVSPERIGVGLDLTLRGTLIPRGRQRRSEAFYRRVLEISPNSEGEEDSTFSSVGRLFNGRTRRVESIEQVGSARKNLQHFWKPSELKQEDVESYLNFQPEKTSTDCSSDECQNDQKQQRKRRNLEEFEFLVPRLLQLENSDETEKCVKEKRFKFANDLWFDTVLERCKLNNEND